MTNLKYIPRFQTKNLLHLLAPGKAIILYGPRRCGKTTLLRHLQEELKAKFLYLSGEDIETQAILSSQSVEKLKDLAGSNEVLVIDEAQKVPNIGLNLKLIVDHIPHVKVIATGSSAFDLARQTGEPLTGRKFTVKLYPLAQSEIGVYENPAQTAGNLESRLIFGSYPEVVVNRDRDFQIQYLKEIVASYLYRDILELEGVRHADKLVRILQMLVFQIGKDVSLNEIATAVGLSKNTVERYLDLLQKAFVLVRVQGFSRNLRKEIAKNARYYFYDLGVRNALINNFNPLSLRDDTGMLWENYIVIERMKNQERQGMAANNFFWRTYDRKEIDWVEERDGAIFGYEIKWGPKTVKAPVSFTETYPQARYEVINQDNYLRFIC